MGADLVPEGTGNAWSLGDSTGSATFCFQVDTPGPYETQTVNQAPDQLSNSFSVEADGQPAVLYDVRASTGFEADQVNDRNVADPVVIDLPAGDHVVTSHHREDGTVPDTVTLQAVAPPAWCLGSGAVELCFAVPFAGTYRIETTDIAPDQLSNSYWVSLDGGAVWLDDVEATGTFATHLVNDRNGDPIEVALTAGDHTLVVANREDGTTLDRVRLVQLP